MVFFTSAEKYPYVCKGTFLPPILRNHTFANSLVNYSNYNASIILI